MTEKSKPFTAARAEPEKRGAEREPFACPVFFDWTVRDEKLLGLIRGRGTISNIQACGVGLISELPLKAGDVLKIYLPVKGTRITLPAFSEVRWVRPKGKLFYAGLQFLG